MAQVSAWLKCLFTFFKVLFVVYAVLVIVLAITVHIRYEQKHGELESSDLSLTPLYILGFTTILLCVLGMYGLYTDNSATVTAFLTMMALGSLSLFILGIYEVVGSALQEQDIELHLRTYIPLDQASKQLQEDMNYFQKQGSCCGLFSFKDWGDKVPPSCHCLGDVSKSQCHTLPTQAMAKHRLIFKEACFPVYLRVDITVAVALGLAVLSFLGMVLSAIIVYQLGRPIPISFTPVYNPDPIIHTLVYNPPPISHTPVCNPPPISHIPVCNPPPISHIPVYNLPPLSHTPVYNSPPISHIPVYNTPPLSHTPVYNPPALESPQPPPS